MAVAWRVAAFLVCAFALRAGESGRLRLYFLQNPVGEETYTLASQADQSLLLTSHFEYTERGSNVPLDATLRLQPDLTPLHLQAKGKSYRPFFVDAAFDLDPATHSATVREFDRTRRATVPAAFFTISGYAPFAVQMMMIRYWNAHGRPARLTQFPAEKAGTEAIIEAAGHDELEIDGRAVKLTRYSIGNIVWGRETVWLDEQEQIAAAVSYAGGLPLEAVREEYAAAFPRFIKSAVTDRISELTETSSRIRPIASGDFAISGATLIDGIHSEAIPDSVVIVRNGRIAAAGPRAVTHVPPGMRTIDVRNATILPGLWEMHAHFAQVEYGPAYLAAGVTSARDCGGEFEFITAVRDAIHSGKALGPHLLLAGLVDGSGTGTFGVNWADTPEQGRAQVARYHEAGFAQMKIYDRIQPEVLRAITAEAHRLGMTVTGHVPRGMTAMQAVEAGMDQINHFGSIGQALRGDAEARARAIAFFRDHHTVIDPTLSWNELLGRPMNVDIASFEPGFAKAPYSLTSVINTAGSPASAQPRPAVPAATAAALRDLYAAGVPIVAGTDKAVPAHSLHRELELYVQAGLTPMQVIQLATSGAAKVMGVDEEVGSIEPGKRADLVLVEGNPLEHFADLRRVREVVTAGRVYSPGDLWKAAGFEP